MLLSCLRIAFRNLRRNKGYSFINIAGLAAGMAITLLIGLWIADELGFDHYHDNHARIAAVMRRQMIVGPTSRNIRVGQSVTTVLDGALSKGYENIIKNKTFISFNSWHLLGTGDKNLSAQGAWAQPSFPAMFTFRMLTGTGASLKDPSTVLLAQHTANALFGDENPVGKTIKLDNKTPYTVGGTFADLPLNTSFHEVQFLLSWDDPQNRYLNANTDWEDHSAKCYIQLAGNVTFDKATARIKDLPVAHLRHERQEVFAYPLDAAHLHDEFIDGHPSGGRILFIWLFGTIGTFILLLACINFMNLSTARSQQRAKEVGIRKTIGSHRYQLISQFLGESILTATLAFIGAIALAAISLPFFNQLAAKQIDFPWTSLSFWAVALGFTLLTGLIAGSYPAFYLSAFKPVKVLKGANKAGKGASLPRKVLVVTQFTVSLSLIIATLIVFKQIQFAKDRPVGYNRDGLLYIPINTDDLATHYEALRIQLLNTGVVTNIARSSQPTTLFDNGNDITWSGQTEEQKRVNYLNVNVTPEFGATVGWHVLQGRDFSRLYGTDSSACILNDAAIKATGLKNPIGMRVTFFGKPYTVIGVVGNLITNSPYAPVDPGIFLGDGMTNFITIRLRPNTPIRTALATLEPLFRRYNPSSSFNYTFIDEEYAQKFAAETRIGALSTIFSGLAILISCLGLFGLAAFVAEQRTKEIGVRKVLGAGILDLWALLSGDFVRLVLISMFIAMPLIALVMNRWLRNYTLHTNLSPWIFIAPGTGILLLTILTVSFQALKAALMNPVRSLRSE